jgi:hypothetical protein
MATKLNLHDIHQQQLDEHEGNPKGTYFAITAMLVLLALVAIYFWIDNGHQFLESPVVQQGKHLTPHDAY